jgi:hypothetical protein
MIDQIRLRRLLLVAAALVASGTGVLLATGQPAAWAGGFWLGYLLGAIPFASWAWIVARGFSRGRRVGAVVLLAAKLGVYGAAIWFLVARPVVHPIAVFLGISAVVAVVVGGALALPARPKEAS